MKTQLFILLLLVLACSNAERMPGSASSEGARQLWIQAVESSNYDAAAALLAPGYRDSWLIPEIVVLAAFEQFDPEVTDAFKQIHKKHGFTLDGLTFRSALEDQFLDGVRKRLAAVQDQEALLADVLRASLEMRARASRLPTLGAVLGITPAVVTGDQPFGCSSSLGAS